MIKRLFATSILGVFVGLGGTAQALAQQAPPAGASNATSVGEVVVTAQRRSERLVDVPITVAVVTGAQLAQRGVTDTTGLQRLTSGVQMDFNGSFLAPAIRGISAAVTSQTVPPNVATYVDGVYQPSQVAGVMDLPDVQDVEILKGPQGTLYGENAEGGAIVITTIAPKFKWQGQANVSYGNYNDIHLSGYETGPISDVIAQSLAGNFENRDGFYTDLLTGQRHKGLQDGLLRGKLLFQPNDKVSITFTAYWDNHVDHDTFGNQPFYLPGYGYEGVARNYDRNGTLLASAGGTSTLPSVYAGLHSPWQSAVYPQSLFGLRTYGADLKGVFDVGLGKFTWLTSYSNGESKPTQMYSASPFLTQFDEPTQNPISFIEEGDFISRPFKPIDALGPIDFSAGLFYMHFSEGFNNDYTAYSGLAFGDYPPAYFPQLASAHNNPYPTPIYREYFHGPAVRDSEAGYLEATWHATDALSIYTGGRYDEETEHAYFNACEGANNTDPSVVALYGPNNGLLPSPGCPGGSSVASEPGNINASNDAPLPVTEMNHSPASWSNFSPRFTGRYKLTPNTNVYFSYSEGFRAGGFNDGGLYEEPFKPETVDAYEVGLKGTLFDRLNFSLAGFHYIYKNKVESINETTACCGEMYVTRNAASANNDGVDLDATWVATSQLTLNASVEWLQATFSSYPDAVLYVPDPVFLGEMDEKVYNLTNHVEERSPRWSGTAGGDYHINTDIGRFNVNVSVYYSSKEYLNSDSFAYNNPYTTIDASLGFSPAAWPNVRLVLWGKNLNDAAWLTSEQASTVGTDVVYAPPRQFGVRAEYKF